MRRFDDAKHERIKSAFARVPGLSDSAVARQTGTHPETVARVRALYGIVTAKRVEASGRRSRGPRQIRRYDVERLPNGRAAVYRAFRHGQLLFVTTSLVFLQRLATLARPPWFHEITTVTITHCEPLEAQAIERQVIEAEQPKYNRALKRGTARAPAQPSRRGVTAGPERGVAQGDNAVRRPTGRVVYKLVRESE